MNLHGWKIDYLWFFAPYRIVDLMIMGLKYIAAKKARWRLDTPACQSLTYHLAGINPCIHRVDAIPLFSTVKFTIIKSCGKS